jgi:broad specificity phosphatase PhoE
MGHTSSVLLLVRHGETAANVDGLLLGRADPPLTERGQAQARALAETLPSPDRVIASPLRRARDTAAAFGRAVEVDDRWIELDYGDLDGRPPSTLPAGAWERWRSDSTAAPGGAEPLATLGERVRGACAELLRDAAEGVVVVVTHVSPIKAAVAWALDVPDDAAWRMYVEDASVTRIDVEPTGPVLRWFNRLAPTA